MLEITIIHWREPRAQAGGTFANPSREGCDVEGPGRASPQKLRRPAESRNEMASKETQRRVEGPGPGGNSRLQRAEARHQELEEARPSPRKGNAITHWDLARGCARAQ